MEDRPDMGDRQDNQFPEMNGSGMMRKEMGDMGPTGDRQIPGMQEDMMEKAIEACSGKDEGDSCSLEGPMEGMDMEGTCELGADSEDLMCAFERQQMPDKEMDR